MARRILLAYDGSNMAQEAAHAAAEIAARMAAKVVVLKVGRLMEAVDGLLLPTMEEEVHYWIAESGAGLVRSLGVTAEARVRWGDPAEEIVGLAKEERASLIVMGHHSVSWIKRLIYRDTDVKVADNAPCPVLIVGGAGRPLGLEQFGEDGLNGQDTTSGR